MWRCGDLLGQGQVQGPGVLGLRSLAICSIEGFMQMHSSCELGARGSVCWGVEGGGTERDTSIKQFQQFGPSLSYRTQRPA